MVNWIQNATLPTTEKTMLHLTKPPVVMRVLAILAALVTTQSARADIGANMVNFLKDWPGFRLGGGECSHLASEALRVAGGEFARSQIGGDFPNTGDYVWGDLVKIVEFKNGRWSDSNPSTRVRPGDIIQYRDAKFVFSNATHLFPHHTSVVKMVDGTGTLPALVFEQNVRGDRSCQVHTINAKKLSAGWIRIYRPIARGARGSSGNLRISVVNYCKTSQTIRIGSKTYTLTANNTKDSYMTFVVSPGTKIFFRDGLFDFKIQNAKCYYMEDKNGFSCGMKNP